MKKEFFPYYVSRAVISSLFSVLVMGLTWKAVLLTVVFFGLFLLYLHSGWFSVDLTNPFFPLRRDPRGQEIQRKALIISIIAGLIIYLSAPLFFGLAGFPLSGNFPLSAGIAAYFAAQFILFSRA